MQVGVGAGGGELDTAAGESTGKGDTEPELNGTGTLKVLDMLAGVGDVDAGVSGSVSVADVAVRIRFQSAVGMQRDATLACYVALMQQRSSSAHTRRVLSRLLCIAGAVYEMTRLLFTRTRAVR